MLHLSYIYFHCTMGYQVSKQVSILIQDGNKKTPLV